MSFFHHTTLTLALSSFPPSNLINTKTRSFFFFLLALLSLLVLPPPRKFVRNLFAKRVSLFRAIAIHQNKVTHPFLPPTLSYIFFPCNRQGTIAGRQQLNDALPRIHNSRLQGLRPRRRTVLRQPCHKSHRPRSNPSRC